MLFALAAGCGSSEEPLPSQLVGVWRSGTVDENGVKASATWHFYADGYVDYVIERSNNGQTVTVCIANTRNSHWEDRGNKLTIRLLDHEEDYLYELTEGGTRLRIDRKPTPQTPYWKDVDVDTYERDASATTDCANAGF
jgi:hypothetical protein